MLVGLLQFAITASAAERTNVLLIVADDLGYSDLGSYGGEIRTPHLDQLAAEGMRFSQFYNNAVCAPTRASLYTGVSPRQGSDGLLRSNMVTLGEVMRAAGYATSLIGKWHLGSKAPCRPIDRGFDYFYGVLSGSCNYFDPSIPDPAFYHSGEGPRRPFVENDTPLVDFPDDYYTTDAFSDRAVEQIHRAKLTGQPFFLNLCYTAPHFPLHAPDEDIARYKGRYVVGYQKLREERFLRQIALGVVDPRVTLLNDADTRTSDYRYDYEIVSWKSLDESTRQREESRMEVYAAMVDRMDQGIGRVLRALEETGQAENTIVVFLSDNGGCASLPEAEKMEEYRRFNRSIPVGKKGGYEFVGPAWGWAQNTPFRRYKGWNYEGGICTPLIVRWPGRIAAGTWQRTPGHVIDFLPTMLELTGISYRSLAGCIALVPLEGRSLLPLMRNQGTVPRTGSLFWAYGGSRAVRNGRWKLVWGAGDSRWELYDLDSDRSESTDLSAQMPDRVRQMARTWEHWAKIAEVPGF